MMTFLDFVSAVKDGVGDYLPPDFQNAEIKINSITKNNGIVKTGLTIRKQEETLCPTLYLDEFYQMHVNEKELSGKELEGLIETIAENYMEAIPKGHMLGDLDISSFDSVKSRIIFCLVNQKENAAFLRQAPYRKMEDLAEIYQISVMENENEAGSIKVNNTLMSLWDVSPEELHTAAIQNTERMYPATFQSMDQVIEALMTGEEGKGNLLQDSRDFQPGPMYVLTNEVKMNGAAVLLYPNILERVQQIIGSDYYVLPSSIHEVLVIPKDTPQTKQEMGRMVREVNIGQVSPEERLSNCIYEYRSDEKSLKQVKESLPKQEKVHFKHQR